MNEEKTFKLKEPNLNLNLNVNVNLNDPIGVQNLTTFLTRISEEFVNSSVQIVTSAIMEPSAQNAQGS